ncbi:MAG: Ig-like domain-containing protein, partial [Terriglobales bacterium]
GRKPGKNGIRPMQPSGTVTWSANTGCAASTLTGSYPGSATCTTSSLAAGSDTVTATYSGDSNHGGSTGSVSQTVNQASQTINVTTAAPSSEVYNGTFTVAATATSGLAVTYGSSGSCSNSGATYTMTSGAGTCTVTMSQSGNSNYSAATPVTESVNATPASQTINVTTPAPATATKGSSFTVVANATSGLPITWGSAGICTNTQGTYTMTGTSGTCTVYMNAPSSVNYTSAPQVVETTHGAAAIAPTVSFTGAPSSSPYQSSFTVTATTNASTTAVITATPSTVCTISGNTVTMVNGTGTCTMKASWAADNVYKAATATQTTHAAKIAPTVTFTGAPSSAVYLSTFPVATSTNSGVTPAITSTTATVCSVSSGTVTMKAGTGTCTVKAAWAANDYYLAATAEQSTTAELIGTTTTITNTVPESNPLKVTVYFTVSNGTSTNAVGNVTVTASSGETCTGMITAGKCVVTFVSADAGSQTLTAVYAGNSNNATSTSAPYGVTVP